MKKKILIISIICVCFILILVGSYLFSQNSRKVKQNDPAAVGNTAGNLYNGGYFCENDGYIYFSNAYDNYSLYRMKPDETEMKKLATTQVNNINVDDNYIYYYQFGSGEGQGFGYVIDMSGVYRADKKRPKNATSLEGVHLDNMILVGNYLYYDANDGNGVYLKKIGTDGNNAKALTDYKVTAASSTKGQIYFVNNVDNFHLMSLNTANDSISDIFKEDLYMPIVEGNEVFCIDIHNNYAMVKYNLSTGEKTVLDSTRTDMFNVTDQFVYYQTSGDTVELRRVPKNGGSYQVVASGAHNSINVTSKYVYFRKFQSEVPVFKCPADGPITITTFDAASKAALDHMKKGKK